jgi:hypothetical protein
MAKKSDTSRRPVPGWFTVDTALEILKQNGQVKADRLTPEQQEVFADLVAAGFAKKDGTAFVYRGHTSPEFPKRAARSVMLIPKQQKIIWGGIICLGILGTYVPWKDADAGYSLIFSPPKYYNARDYYGKLTGERKPYLAPLQLDLPRIILPMFVVACATIAGAFFARDRTSKQAERLS